ncbi:hypothetical protein MAR_002025, partial [Mya arenaria]
YQDGAKIALLGDSYIARLGKHCHYDLRCPGQVQFFSKGGMKASSPRYINELIYFKPNITIITLGGGG